MKSKKIIFIILFIILIAIFTIIFLTSNMLKPKTTSKELYVKANKDLGNFGIVLSDWMTDMSNIMKDESGIILDNNNNIDLSKSKKFINIKEQVDQKCDLILNYNTNGFSTDMVEYINYAKKVANEVKEFFNKINGKMDVNEHIEELNNFSSKFNKEMEELTELSNRAFKNYSEENKKE